ncbi:S-layer homology domain-containing protein [Anaerosolibacter sp.]|uniref:S-layer homology domain-containing protein n=1 Tax=Anaerosolibacter sp. TaxID=1872527 RepID=UPI0039EFDD27
MKKLMSVMLMMILLMGAAVPSYAAGFTPPGLAKKGGLPPGIAKKFSDLDGFEWAQEAIERLAEKGILSGIGEGKFAPSNNVTKIEALTMIIRGLDWDDDVKLAAELINTGKIKERAKDKAKDKDKLQGWTEGYIEVAVEKGLIDEVDLAQQNFTAPATRQEVAMYIIRALGMEEEAEDYSSRDLRFEDKAAVQIGAVGYVYLIDSEGIMKGYPDGTFRPNQLVKRAEMASLVNLLRDRIGDEEDDDDDVVAVEGTFKGNIESIDRQDKEIVVKNSSTEKLFKIENNTVVKIDGRTKSFSDLSFGMDVELKIIDGKVDRIDAQTNTATFTGTIKQIYPTTDELKIKVGNTERTIQLDSGTDIEIDEKDAGFDKLVLAMEVEVKIENGKVVALYAESVTSEYTGKLTEKVEGTQNKITIKIGNQYKSYVVSKNADIQDDDGDDMDFNELKVGSEIEIRVENNIIVKIEMED